nr:N-acetylglucosamine-6-phosphate deacetylase [uncultured Blautia sp.]
MIIDHVKVFTEDKKFTDGGIVIKDGTIEQVYTEGNRPQTEDEALDGKGMYAIPGLIDLHFHGCKGDDFCDGSRDAIARIAEYEASVGVTAIAPATMTLPVEELEQILRVAAEYKKGPHSKKEADFVGINMEGPFISPAKKGAQDERNIIPCDVKVCERFLEASEGLVKFMGIAPEESENAVSFIEAVRDKVNVSLAHTNADYDTAMAAFNAGADHAVHLYNAMPAFTHRAPGVIGAVYDSKHVMAEIICDGVHIHPATVRATFEMMGEDRMILISDSMRAAGMPDGSYTLGGLDVNVVGNRATLASDGAIAGSVTNLMDCMKTAVKTMNIPLETAVACATINPAKSLGIDAEYGSIRAGKKAHIVLMDQELNVQQVIKDGELL